MSLLASLKPSIYTGCRPIVIITAALQWFGLYPTAVQSSALRLSLATACLGHVDGNAAGTTRDYTLTLGAKGQRQKTFKPIVLQDGNRAWLSAAIGIACDSPDLAPLSRRGPVGNRSTKARSSRSCRFRAIACDCRRACAAKCFERTSRIQICIGRRPAARNDSGCLRTRAVVRDE